MVDLPQSNPGLQQRFAANRAIQAIRAGDKVTGKRLLAQLLQADRDNEVAWLWLSAVVDSDDQRRNCLEQVLRIHPGHAQAAAGLARLNASAAIDDGLAAYSRPASPPPPSSARPTTRPDTSAAAPVWPPAASVSPFGPLDETPASFTDAGSLFGDDNLFAGQADDSSFDFGAEVTMPSALPSWQLPPQAEPPSPPPAAASSAPAASGAGRSFWETPLAESGQVLPPGLDAPAQPPSAKPAPVPSTRGYAWYELWMGVLTGPSVKSFQFVLSDPKLSFDRGVWWIFLAGLLQYLALAAVIQTGVLSTLTQDPNFMMLISQDARLATLISKLSLVIFIGAPVLASFNALMYTLQIAIQHVSARIVGGRGSYTNLVYATAAFQAPVLLITSLIIFIPYLGACLGLPLSIYMLVLTVNAVRAVYNLDILRAVLAIFLPGLVIFLLSCLAAFALRAALPQLELPLTMLLPVAGF